MVLLAPDIDCGVLILRAYQRKKSNHTAAHRARCSDRNSDSENCSLAQAATIWTINSRRPSLEYMRQAEMNEEMCSSETAL